MGHVTTSEEAEKRINSLHIRLANAGYPELACLMIDAVRGWPFITDDDLTMKDIEKEVGRIERLSGDR